MLRMFGISLRELQSVPNFTKLSSLSLQKFLSDQCAVSPEAFETSAFLKVCGCANFNAKRGKIYKNWIYLSEKDSWWSQIIFKLGCSLQAWCIEKWRDKYIFQFRCFQAAGTFEKTFAFTSLATALLSPCSLFGEQKKINNNLAVCHEQKAALGLCFKINTIMGF